MSPVLEGGFLTTGPPGKSPVYFPQAWWHFIFPPMLQGSWGSDSVPILEMQILRPSQQVPCPKPQSWNSKTGSQIQPSRLQIHHCLNFVLSCSVGSGSFRPCTCSLPGSSVHGVLQARVLEWVAMLSSRGIFPGLLHCRQILYGLSRQESPTNPTGVYWERMLGRSLLVLTRKKDNKAKVPSPGLCHWECVPRSCSIWVTRAG